MNEPTAPAGLDAQAAPARPAAQAPLLRLANVRHGYREAGAWHEVLRGVDLEVRAGERVALLGHSGSGKSTLLHLAGGLDAPVAGRVEFGGVDVASLGEPARSLWRRAHVGFVYQFFNLIPTLTVLENVLLPLELNGAGGREGRGAALDLLSEVGLAGRAGSFPDRLSGGEQQRVAVARALAHRPRLLLADEPTGSLDSAAGGAVLDLLDRLVRARGAALLMATHSGEVAARADRAVRLADGVLAEGG